MDVLVLITDKGQRFDPRDDRFESVLQDISRHGLFHRFLVVGLFLVTVQIQIGHGDHFFFDPWLAFLRLLDAFHALQQVPFKDIQFAGQ